MKEKAGFIPYYKNLNGNYSMMFMIPSDFKYGGPSPQIIKGQVDNNESSLAAAIREAQEEGGLKFSNLIKDTIQVGWNGLFTNKSESCSVTVYIGEIKDKKDFNKPCFETGSLRWFNNEQFKKYGRKTQREIVSTCYEKILLK